MNTEPWPAVAALDVCGCAQREVLEWVRDVLRAYKAPEVPLYIGGEIRPAILTELFPVDDRQLHVLLSFLDNANLIEHGVAIRGSWITDTGMRVLADLEAMTAAGMFG